MSTGQGLLSESQGERWLIRRAFIIGVVTGCLFLPAAIGWTAHWNAYVNLLLTLCPIVIVWSGIASTLDRYQLRKQ